MTFDTMNRPEDNVKTMSTKPGCDSLEQEVFLHLWKTYDRLKAIEEEVLGKVGLSAQQYNALRCLRWAAPAAIATLDLGRQLVSRAPDITRMLDRLEHRGLLKRERLLSNRRVVEVKITVAGETLLDEVHEEVLECHVRQLGHLDQKSLKQLAKLLKAARLPHESPAAR